MRFLYFYNRCALEMDNLHWIIPVLTQLCAIGCTKIPTPSWSRLYYVEFQIAIEIYYGSKLQENEKGSDNKLKSTIESMYMYMYTTTCNDVYVYKYM